LFVFCSLKISFSFCQEFFSGVDTMLESRKDEEVGFSLSYNKNACRKVIREFSAKDVRWPQFGSIYLIPYCYYTAQKGAFGFVQASSTRLE